MKYPLLLAPLAVGPISLKNRIVVPPMATSLAQGDGLVNQNHLDHYGRIMGAGLVIVEGTAVLPEGRINKRQLSIHSDRYIDGLKILAKLIHDNGSAAGIQIAHAGVLSFPSANFLIQSHVASIVVRLIMQQLWFFRFRDVRKAFVNAVRRAEKAGFDVVEIHGAHGYLFGQFFSPLTNWRLSGYGGSRLKRQRLLLEVTEDIQSLAVGKTIVTCRLGVADGHVFGLPLSDGIKIAAALEYRGMKIIDISNGRGFPPYMNRSGSPYSSQLHLARLVKSRLSIPVIGTGGIRHPDMAEKALQNKMADLIAVGRGVLADPRWAEKTSEGNAGSIILCRECKPCSYYSNGFRCPVYQA